MNALGVEQRYDVVRTRRDATLTAKWSIRVKRMMLFHSTPKDREDREVAEDLVRLALKRMRDRANGKLPAPENDEEEDDDD